MGEKYISELAEEVTMVVIGNFDYDRITGQKTEDAVKKCQTVLDEVFRTEFDLCKKAALKEAATEYEKIANGIIAWMENKEAGYSADELRSMAKKARCQILAIRALIGGGDV